MANVCICTYTCHIYCNLTLMYMIFPYIFMKDLVVVETAIFISGENNSLYMQQFSQSRSTDTTSTRETIDLFSNGNYNIRSQTDFLATAAKLVCKHMIRVISQNMLQRLKNRANQDKLSMYFNCLLSNQSIGSVQWGHVI